MTPVANDELIILRHAPADHAGRLCGRTDVAACLPGSDALAPLARMLAGCAAVVSPAKRCVQTANAVFGGLALKLDDALWEQNFGANDGRLFSELPDLGPLSLDQLAEYRAEGGESFLDMTARVTPALLGYAEQVRATKAPMVLVAHAGTARAAIGLALGAPAYGLKFEIAPVSLTRLRCFEGGFSVITTNQKVIN